MLSGATKKNKINLEDYPYERDTHNRLLMSSFSVFDVEVLEEILNSSLLINLDSFADNLGSTVEALMPTIEKLEKTNLFKRTKEGLEVDKEMRKYYEFQILKFDDNFEPSMEFLQGLLKKVPIHVLPVWYTLPRTSDNIFASIIEKYLATPQIYQRHITELCFADPKLTQIQEEVFNSPDLKVRSKHLREKFDISREEFEIYMLTLEFNFICCLSYAQVGDDWKEVVTPFHEWSSYIKQQRANAPKGIKNIEGLRLFQHHPFTFIRNMCQILKEAKKKPLSLQLFEDNYSLDSKQITKLQIDTHDRNAEECAAYTSRLIKKICQIHLGEVEEDHTLHISSSGEEWVGLDEEDQAFHMYRHPLNKLLDDKQSEELYPPKCARDIESSLTVLKEGNWVYLRDVLNSLNCEIGNSGKVELHNKGRQWFYSNPEYSETDLDFVKTILTQKLRRIGVLEMGFLGEDEVLRLTPFGKTALGLD